ncbi:MAG: RNA-directed DNA polymerase (Reverse transcriptase), partial [Candidatus Moranbacteria bacterium GW2011_GWF2_36_839]
QDYIPDENILKLLEKVISSFNTSPYPLLEKERGKTGVGLPLGNLTSQLFVNVYMNKFDQFMKHKIKAKYYIRYADDFIILSKDKKELEESVELIRVFLQNELKLEIHPNKISIETFSSGVDFLGMVNFPKYRILRTKTKRRILKKIQNKKNDLENGMISQESFRQSLQSYLGVLKHCAGWNISEKIENLL